MIGNDTHCAVCHKPMRSCVVPAVCGECLAKEKVDSNINPIVVSEEKDQSEGDHVSTV